MGQGEKKEAICPICKAPLDLVICHSIVDRWPHMNLEDIFPGGQCDFLSWEACPNAGDETHLRAYLARKIKNFEFCSICERKVREKGDESWICNERMAEMIEEMLGYPVHAKHVHHTSYFPEVTIVVCDSCHAKIHHSNDEAYTKYRPDVVRKNLKERWLENDEAKVKDERWEDCFKCKNLGDTCDGGNSLQCGNHRYSDKNKIKIGVPATKGKVLHGLH